jgi:beta-lactamase class A
VAEWGLTLLVVAGVLIWWRWPHEVAAGRAGGAEASVLTRMAAGAQAVHDAIAQADARHAPAWAPERPDTALQRLVEQLVDEENGDTAVVVQHLTSGAAATYNSHTVFPAASLAKVPILVEVHRRLAAGTLRESDLVTITADAITDGAGVLQARAGEQISVAELLSLSVTVSDNVAARLLLRLVGGVEAVNRTMDEMGLRHTRLYADERPNVTDAGDMARLLAWAAAQGVAVPAAAAPVAEAVGEYAPRPRTLAWLLTQPQAQAWVAAGLPAGTLVAHKSGQLPSLRHEAAVIYTPRGPVAVVGLTDHLRDQDEAEAFLGRLARDVYRYFAAR